MSDPLPPRPPLPAAAQQKPTPVPPPLPPAVASSPEAPVEPSAHPPPQSYAGYATRPGVASPSRPGYAPAPGYAPPAGYAQTPGYAPPAGYAQTPGYAPAPGHVPPPGYPVPPAGSPTAARNPAYGGPLAAPARTRTVGRVALVAGILAFVGSTIVVSIAAFQIGLGAGRELASRPLTVDFDWSILTPVRDWVLLGESAFWAGTILGLWALVQGIVAVVTDRGRGAGVAAVVLAIVAPIAFAIALNVFLTMGLAAGSGIGG